MSDASARSEARTRVALVGAALCLVLISGLAAVATLCGVMVAIKWLANGAAVDGSSVGWLIWMPVAFIAAVANCAWSTKLVKDPTKHGFSKVLLVSLLALLTFAALKAGMR